MTVGNSNSAAIYFAGHTDLGSGQTNVSGNGANNPDSAT